MCTKYYTIQYVCSQNKPNKTRLCHRSRKSTPFVSENAPHYVPSSLLDKRFTPSQYVTRRARHFTHRNTHAVPSIVWCPTVYRERFGSAPPQIVDVPAVTHTVQEESVTTLMCKVPRGNQASFYSRRRQLFCRRVIANTSAVDDGAYFKKIEYRILLHAGAQSLT